MTKILLDMRHKIGDTRYETQDGRHKTGDTRQETQDMRHKTGDTRQETQDRRHKIGDTQPDFYLTRNMRVGRTITVLPEILFVFHRYVSGAEFVNNIK